MKCSGSFDERAFLWSRRIRKEPQVVVRVVQLLREGQKVYAVRKDTHLHRKTIANIRTRWDRGELNDWLEYRGLPPRHTESWWRTQLEQALSGIPQHAHALSHDPSRAFAVLSLRIPDDGVEGATPEEVTNFQRLQECLKEMQVKLEELQRRSNQAQEELGWPTNPAIGQPGFLRDFADSISQELLMCCGQLETASCCGGHAGGRCGYRRKATSFDGYFMLVFEGRQNWEIALGDDDSVRRCEEIHRQVSEECTPIANALLRLHRQVDDLKHLLRLAASTPPR